MTAEWHKATSPDKDLLELWGQTLLEMSKLSKNSQAFFNLFQNGYARQQPESIPHSAYKQFADLCYKTFGKEGIETFNAIMMEFYENVGVVPRTQYNELVEKYIRLKDKVEELEEQIKKLKEKLEDGDEATSDLIEQWTRTVEKYAKINRQFFKEFSKFF
jgi:chromosome segregation ATPase